MLSFKEYSNRVNTIQSDLVRTSLGIPRRNMPQIESKNVQDFMSWLKKEHNVLSRSNTEVVKNLKATQKHMDAEKVIRLATEAPDTVLKKHVIVSNDGYLLDGHHRWASLYIKNPNDKIQVYEIATDIKSLLTLARRYPKSYTKNLSETAAS